MKNKKCLFEPVLAVASNLLLSMVVFTLTRIIFILMNTSLFPDVDFSRGFNLCVAGLQFDLSAVLYTNLPYVLAALLPLAVRTRRWYVRMTKWLYVVPNFAATVANLVDVVYYPYTDRRMTFSFFNEFSNESNLASIIFREIGTHWYLFILGAGLLVLLMTLFRKPRTECRGTVSYHICHTVILLLIIYPTVAGLRGGFGVTTRPITLSNANKYINNPIEAGIVLNSPFCIYRTISKTIFEDPGYFSDPEEMTALFDAVHKPSSESGFKPKNVCVFILESFSASYSEFLTREQGRAYEGYMPFLDSLMQESLCFRWSFANGRKSIEAMPSSLSGIPSLVEPFFLTPYSTNTVSGIAGELVAHKGYNASFFHGAPEGSMGFEAFSHITGYEGQYNKETYGNDADFDGTWAIWDGPFFQYFKKQMDSFREPFVSTIFSATSHHPYVIPQEYRDTFRGGSMPMFKCVQYSDNALREFFREARKSPWFENTVFVITGDHTGVTDRDEYHTTYGIFEIPILIYSPSGDIKGYRDGIAQQADIMPTVLGYLGYDRPFVSFGCNLLTTSDEDTFAINYLNGRYQFYKGDWCLQFNGRECEGLYNFKTDHCQAHNMMEERPDIAEEMLPQLKSIIQQYMERMVNNHLTYDE